MRLSKPAAKIRPPKKTKVISPNLEYALSIMRGIIINENTIPIPNGKRISTLRLEIL